MSVKNKSVPELRDPKYRNNVPFTSVSSLYQYSGRIKYLGIKCMARKDRHCRGIPVLLSTLKGFSIKRCRESRKSNGKHYMNYQSYILEKVCFDTNGTTHAIDV